MENLFLGGDLDIKISNKQFRQAAGVFETVREFWPERTKIARLRASRNCAWMRSGLKSFSAASRAFAARRPCSGSDAASFSRAPRSIDGDALPLVFDSARIAVTADLGSRLEEVDVEGAGKEVGRGHATRTGADDGHASALRCRAAVSGGGGRRVGPERRAGAERRQPDRALEDLATGQ